MRWTIYFSCMLLTDLFKCQSILDKFFTQHLPRLLLLVDNHLFWQGPLQSCCKLQNNVESCSLITAQQTVLFLIFYFIKIPGPGSRRKRFKLLFDSPLDSNMNLNFRYFSYDRSRHRGRKLFIIFAKKGKTIQCADLSTLSHLDGF